MLIQKICLFVLLVVFVTGFGLAFYRTGFLSILGVCLAFLAFVIFPFLLIPMLRNTERVEPSVQQKIKTITKWIIFTSCFILFLLGCFCRKDFFNGSVELGDFAGHLFLFFPLIFNLVLLFSERRRLCKKLIDEK
jgi:hypothetical protein